ncbi:hypothetical protein [Cytobacillus sp. NCCP-133]|uniref:hypothetical protein n=1 Tax=Cytobacillus sp. NCCP-133 TaxID=766848 RepID=UPI002231317D|nr:hypothetical protein [Cytobacillus sp. NCCP-133]GLB58204.1 hypothetical protein NCCP133_03370 [Cytobacillus sp. NCCP-133]
MNKRNTRAFSFGILITVLIMGTVYFFDRDDASPNMQKGVEAAKQLVIQEGYMVLTQEEYANLQEKIKNASKPETAQKEQKTGKAQEEPSSSYQLEIVSGMTPGEIAEQLKNKNIVNDAEEFGRYLEEYGYSKKIQLGTFELSSQMSYQDIAKLITKS